MKRQTYKGPIQWIVVDDSEPKTKTTMGQTYLKGPKTWRPGINTQRPNMDCALAHVKGDYIFVIEDDDYYAEDYLEKYIYMLKDYSAVGEANALYYNILSRSWRRWGNFSPHNTFALSYASLCQSAIRKELLPRLDEAINCGELWPDIALWRILNNHKVKPFLFCGQDLCVGIKGMPGREGIGAGHHPDPSFEKDPSWAKLDTAIGVEDARYYKELVKTISVKPVPNQINPRIAAAQMVPKKA